uniref:F-BAR domain-containing protein n=1 Tax=Panagrellus redivivus TaxID=6233 RepID=A0A7E4VJF9_PANRE
MSCQNLSDTSGFFEIGAYKTNIRRIKDGVEELDEFSRMVKERADLEAKYAKTLLQWHDKWSGYVAAKVPHGVIRQSWGHVLEEGQELAKLHNGLKERCSDEIVRTIALFKKENHHSRPFGSHSKEIHDIAEAFEKAQKQWKKLYEKVESAKKAYHSACRAEKSATVQLTNAAADSALSPDAQEKLRERCEKLKDESRKTRVKYENELTEINKYKHVYIENMGFVFEKCQQMEFKRMKFAMEMMSGVRCVLGDLVDAEKLRQLHENLKTRFRTVGETEFNSDLKDWSGIHGVDAPTYWPAFEEYTPEMRNITSKQARAAGGIVLTKKVTNSDEFPDVPPPTTSSGHSSRPLSTITTDYHRQNSAGSAGDSASTQSKSSDTVPTVTELKTAASQLKAANRTGLPGSPFHDPFPMRTPEAISAAAAKKGILDTPVKRNGVTSTQPSHSATSSDSGSFDDHAPKSTHAKQDSTSCNIDPNGNEVELAEAISNDEDDAIRYGDFNQIRGPAKALYDYIPIENDEMALKKGELLEVLSGPDHLGWCMGRKKEESGLFPASYVAPL